MSAARKQEDDVDGKQPGLLITGTSGFVGRNLVAALAATDRPFASWGREAGTADGQTDWTPLLGEGGTVLHLAGRHVGDAQVFERDIEMTLNLARQAAAKRVGRFVFLSSIKVNGETTGLGQVFHETDTPRPLDLYGRSKLRIEQALVGLDLPVTIVRVPLVYGPGVKANFRRLIDAVERGWPLPLAAVNNRRSMLAVGNLCDFLLRVADEPAAVGQTYLLADGEDVSISDLLRRLARVMDRPSRLLPVPPGLLEAALRVVGRGGVADRLLGDLRVDIAKVTALGWRPPLSLDEGLAAAVWPPQGFSNT